MQKKLYRQTLNIVYYCFLGICLLSSLQLKAQKKEELSYYNMQLLQKADGYFNAGDYYNALPVYRKILKKVPLDTTVILRIAECYKELNSFDESEIWYGKVLYPDIELSVDAKHKLNYAQVLTINGKYDDALYWYKEYYFTNATDPRGIAGIKTIENLNRLYYDTMFYVAFPAEINTVYAEFSPVQYNNGVVFVSDRPKASVSGSDKGNKPSYTSWYFSDMLENGSLDEPVRFNKKGKIKTSLNEGPVVFYDNYSKMIFTQNTNIKEKNKSPVKVFPVQIYSAVKIDEDHWDEIKLLDFCDSSLSYSQPAITSDGTKLIFSSNMPGGFGGSDLYMSRFENGIWQEPVNMGEKINSKGNEMFPYILSDSVLYFSSDGHGGLGGLDICYVPLDNTGQLVNLGFPVNSQGDDFGIIYDKDGMSGYFSSNRTDSKGRDDIYAFRIIRVSLTLKIIDIKTSAPLAGAEVFSISGMDENLVGTTDQDGYCTVVIPVSKEIKIRVKKEDFESQVFTFEPMKYKTENTVVVPVDDTRNVVAELPEKVNENVLYKVQVMATRQPATSREIKKKYKGELPVIMNYEDDWYKYTIGEFYTYSEACECLSSCDVADAFIAGYINDTRVSIVVAKSATNEMDTCQPVIKTKPNRKR